MKSYSILFLCAFLCTQFTSQGKSNCHILSDTIIQNFHKSDQVKATKKEGLIRLRLTDFRKNKLGQRPIWVHNKKGQYWHGTTDENGELFLLLPNNSHYLVNVDQEVDYRKFSIPRESKYFKTVKVVLMTTRISEVEKNDTIYQDIAAGIMPSMSRALVNIKIMDLNGNPLANEVLCYDAQKSKKVYYTSTDARGQSSLMLPKGDTYCIHSYTFRDITCKKYEDNNSSRTSRFELKTISTFEFQKRERERKMLLARRDSLRHLQRLQDSIMLTRNEYQNFYLQHRYQKRDYQAIEASIKTLASKDQQAVSLNKNHYAEVGEEIKSMFQRNKNQWKRKRVIANIDCSMYQYIDELMVWNFTDQEEQQNNTYWLFNGFNYKDAETDGHSRRGIFHVPENNVQGFFNTIDKIVNFSCRGSRLENVVEALILGAEGKTTEEDLLFIADNYSDVSDLGKLNQLTVPVHILLTDSKYGVNENYLEIAYHTGGSIHTQHEDISSQQLKDLTDGDRLLIGEFMYTFFKGKFLKVG